MQIQLVLPSTVTWKLACTNLHKCFSSTDYRHKIQQCTAEWFFTTRQLYFYRCSGCKYLPLWMVKICGVFLKTLWRAFSRFRKRCGPLRFVKGLEGRRNPWDVNLLYRDLETGTLGTTWTVLTSGDPDVKVLANELSYELSGQRSTSAAASNAAFSLFPASSLAAFKNLQNCK